MPDCETLIEDYKARIQEIQQIVAQRFQLATLAILVFTGVAGWLTTYLARLPNNPQENPSFVVSVILPGVSILLIVILAVLYYEYFALLRVLRIFSTYLKVRFSSKWETEWDAYRADKLTKKYPGYSKSGYRIFSFLAILSVGYPSFFLIPYSKYIDWNYTKLSLGFILFLLIVFLVMLYLTTYHQKWFIKEDELVEGWKRVLLERPDTTKGGILGDS